jgi:fumarate hydratase subunit alpha
MSMVREIPSKSIEEAVRGLFLKANVQLGQDVKEAIEYFSVKETSPLGRHVLERILENAGVAVRESLPICQDTGLAVIFLEIGQDVHITEGNLEDAVQAGVRRAYQDGCFRKSLCDPLTRMNTGDNTPAISHVDIVPGDRIRVVVMPKGGGSENMSSVTMLIPAESEEGIKNHVVEQVRRAGPNPCPPVIVGVGIGGTMETAVLLAKKALLRPVGGGNRIDKRLALMEQEILDRINRLGIGPQGYGGLTTALAVHVEMRPCHIASLPVAVNIQCHAARHAEAIL